MGLEAYKKNVLADILDLKVFFRRNVSRAVLVALFWGLYGMAMSQPSFTSSPVTTGKVEVDYSYPIQVTDDLLPINVTFELISAAPGLSLNIIDGDQAELVGIPQEAGTFNVSIRATNDADESADQDFQLVIDKGDATIALSNLVQEYADAPTAVTTSTIPAGLNVDITYNGSTQIPVNAGLYIVQAVINDLNYSGSVSGQMEITPKTLTVDAEDAVRPFNTANPAFNLIYNGFAGNDAPSDLDQQPVAQTTATIASDAGTYPITIEGGNDQNYAFNYLQGILTITKANATVNLNGLSFTYDGSPKSPSVTTVPEGLTTSLTFNGSPSLPVNAGTYDIEATINEINYQGSAQAELTIAKSAAQISLSNLIQNFDGNPKAVTVNTTPGGLDFTVTYNGSASLPVNPGTYAVLAEITDINFSGSASGTLLINSGPVASVIADITVNEDAANSSVPLNNYFEDGEDADSELNMEIISNSNPTLFSSVNINASNVLILDYAPNRNGSSQIVVRATDTGGLFTETSFTVTVNPQPDPPVFTSTAVTGAVQGQQYVYNISVSDPDANETFTFNVAIPSWLSFQDTGNGTGRLSGTPGNSDVGSHVVALEVTDRDGLKGTQFFTIIVGNSNDAPFFTSIPVEQATEGVRYTYNVTTSDPDGDSRVISAPEIPSWLGLTDNGNGTAVLSGIPGNADGGANSVRLRVEDPFGAQAIQSFTINVDNTNNPPFFVSTPVTSVNEDAPYNYLVEVDDPDANDVLEIDVLARPAWLQVSNNTSRSLQLTGTPSNNDVGTSSVVISVTDAEGAQANQNFSITVVNVNDKPVFTSIPVTAALQGSEYVYSINTVDVDAGDSRTIRATQKPAWLTLVDNGNGSARLSGTPGNGDFGVNPVTIIVEDRAGASSQQSFNINVDNVNDPPVFTSTPVTQATEDVLYRYNITTSDPDNGDTRTISSLALPAWLTLVDNGNGTAVIQGTPANAQVGNHSVVLNVRDALGANTNQNFTISVSNTNDPPVFTSNPITSALQDIEYRYEVRTNDVDANDTWTLVAETLPSWLTLSDLGNGNALISGTPRNTNLGANSVRLKVTDASGSSTFQNFTIIVDNINDAPAFSSSPVTSVLEDNAYVYNIRATDPDAGDILTIRSVVLPPWLTLTDNGNGTALLSGTPVNRNVGSNSVVITVEDIQGLTATQNFTIVVQNTNDAPVFSSNPVTGAIQNVTYTYSILTTDPDAGDQRRITAVNLPSWLTLTDLGNGTGVLSGTPTNAHLGANAVSLRVTDLAGTSTDQNFTINVDNVNDAPAFTSTPVSSINEDQLYEYLVTTSDPDQGDTRSIVAFSLPSWLTLTDNGDGSALLSGIPLNANVGSHNVVLNVRDGLGANANQSFTIEVINTNDVPFFISQPVPVAVQNEVYRYNAEASDPDLSDVLFMSAPEIPAWLSFTYNGQGKGVLQGTPTNSDLGLHEVRLVVTDRDGAASEQLFTVVVDNANDAPFFTSSPVTEAQEDIIYEYLITSSDPDQGDIRNFSALSIPDWLSLVDNGDGTARLAGTPVNEDVGNDNVVLRVRDALGLFDDQSFTIAIENTNDAPTFTSSPITGAIQDVLYTYNITTADPDAGDTRSISLIQGPSWINLTNNGNGSASLTGIPRNADLGLNEVIIEVVDAAGAATSQVFQINVDNQNDPPSFSSTPLTSVNQDELYQYLVNTSDADVNDTRRIVALTLPVWMEIEDNGDGTAIITGTPGNDEVGSHNVVLEVTDALGAKDTQSFTVVVNNVNDAPRFTSDPVILAKVGNNYSYSITAIDPDANATLSFTVPVKPSWLSLTVISNGSARLAGTPPVSEVNKEFEVQIVVTDNGGLQSEQQYNIRTEYPNIPPTIQALSDISGIQEDAPTITVPLTGISAGRNENQTISISSSASNALLFENIAVEYTSPSSNGILKLTPAANAFGTSTVTVRVQDNGDVNLNNSSVSFSVEIEPVNDAPVFASQPVTKISLGDNYTYSITASDADPDDVLIIRAISKPTWLNFVDNGDGSALLSGTVPESAIGQSVTLRVRDQAGLQSDQSFTLQVNRRPLLSDVFLDGFEDTTLPITLNDFLAGYNDPDGDAPSYIEITSLPEFGTLSLNGTEVTEGIQIASTSGSIDGLEYIPSADFNGTDQFGWNSFDGEVSASSEARMILQIQAVNDPPVLSNIETSAINYSQGQGEVFLTQSVTVNDIDNNQIAGARVAITANYVRGEDILLFPNELTPELNVSFDSNTGILTMDGVSSKSQYERALSNVKYTNSLVGDVEFTSKQISFFANDGTDESAGVVRTLIISEVFPELDLVNAFTPNGDGVNDVWDIGNLQAYRNSVLSIFDGNGNEVFQCNGTDCTWDGKRGGKLLPAGPYYYVIKLNDGQQVHRGTVSILR